MEDSPGFDALLEEALLNAQKDRGLTMNAYEKMKPIFEIDSDDPQTLQSVMLVGQQAVKLLEQLSRSNEQIIKLSQLRQKDRPSSKDRKPVDLEELKLEMSKYSHGGD